MADVMTASNAPGTQAQQTDSQQLAQGMVDPNTGLAQAPAAPLQPLISPGAEQQAFVDEWAKAPTADGVVRTWRDPSKLATPEGQYLSAFYDTPTGSSAKPPPPVSAVVASVQTPVPTAAPAAPQPIDSLSEIGQGSTT